MTIFGYICVALLVAYWLWLLMKTGSNRSYVMPGIITIVLGGLAMWSFMTPVYVPPPMLGGRRYRW